MSPARLLRRCASLSRRFALALLLALAMGEVGFRVLDIGVPGKSDDRVLGLTYPIEGMPELGQTLRPGATVRSSIPAEGTSRTAPRMGDRGARRQRSGARDPLQSARGQLARDLVNDPG